jgi:hypothetical protein
VTILSGKTKYSQREGGRREREKEKERKRGREGEMEREK